MLHLDEAWQKAAEALGRLLETRQNARAVLIEDLYGKLRVVLWDAARSSDFQQEVTRELTRVAEDYWSGEVWMASGARGADQLVYGQAWDEARDTETANLKLLERHRNRGAWLGPVGQAPWDRPSGTGPWEPPAVVFYSFKGGVGRSTALASFAIQRARMGERVVVVDADLDAPGVGTLLAADLQGTTARWGVVDYLLEQPLVAVDLGDYYHTLSRETVSGPGEILVIPAGEMDAQYLGKLARMDLEPPDPGTGPHPLSRLLEQVRADLRPRWILLDSRSGLADPTGMLLSGLSHLHVLFGTSSEQTWKGLRLILDRLGRQRVLLDPPQAQADCFMVHAMVPTGASGPPAREMFADRARDEFLDAYYAEDSVSTDASETLWTVSDAGGSDAPDVPSAVTYDPNLADFRTLDDVVDLLAESTDYSELARRIQERFGGG